MLKNRLIAVIIIRDGKVVQSEKFQHTNVIHYDAYHAVESFNRWSVDEIILLNVSKEKSSQEEFLSIVKRVSKTCFVPLAVGGFIDSIEYGSRIIKNGADKIVINSLWFNDVTIVRKLANKFGSQCIVASIDIKNTDFGDKVFINRGEYNIEKELGYWSEYCEKNGAGEILFNNIDYDGNRKGYDLESIKKITQQVSIPVIAFGGVFTWKHLLEGFEFGADAVAAANIFHYKEMATKQARRFLLKNNVSLRDI